MDDKRYFFVVDTSSIVKDARLDELEPNQVGYYSVPFMFMRARTLNDTTYRNDSSDLIKKCIKETLEGNKS